MRRASTLAITLRSFVFATLIPITTPLGLSGQASNPCRDQVYVRLQQIDLNEMTEREYETFTRKDQQCMAYRARTEGPSRAPSGPCVDTRYLALKETSVGELTARELDYYRTRHQECVASMGEEDASASSVGEHLAPSIGNDPDFAPAAIDLGPAARAIYEEEKRSPTTALLLGFAFPGAGQFYNGDVIGGLGVMAIVAGSWVGGVYLFNNMSCSLDEFGDSCDNWPLFAAFGVAFTAYTIAALRASGSAGGYNRDLRARLHRETSRLSVAPVLRTNSRGLQVGVGAQIRVPGF